MREGPTLLGPWGAVGVTRPEGAEGGGVPVESPEVVGEVECRGRRGGETNLDGSLCPVCGARSRRVREHVVGRHLPPMFRSTVPQDETVQDLRYRALRWLAESLLGVRVSPFELAKRFTVGEVFGPCPGPWDPRFIGEMVAFCESAGSHYPSVWPLHGTLHPAMLLHWRVQCAVLNGLSAADRQKYVGLLANEVVAGRRLAEYPNRAPSSSVSPSAAEGSLRGRRGFVVVSDPSYASECPIPREPRWDLELGAFPPAPEETASPSGRPELPGGKEGEGVTGSGFPRDASRGGPPQLSVGLLGRIGKGSCSPPVMTTESTGVEDSPLAPQNGSPPPRPDSESTWAEEVGVLDTSVGVDPSPTLATVSLEEVFGPVPLEEDLFLAIPLEPERSRGGPGEDPVLGPDVPTPTPSLALLRPGEQWEVDAAPRREWKRLPPGKTTAELVDCVLPLPDGTPRVVTLAYFRRW